MPDKERKRRDDIRSAANRIASSSEKRFSLILLIGSDQLQFNELVLEELLSQMRFLI